MALLEAISVVLLPWQMEVLPVMNGVISGLTWMVIEDVLEHP